MKPVRATDELSYRVRFTGHSGHLAVEPLYTVERDGPVNSLPDFVVPPAFPRETRESLKSRIEETYLLPRLDADEFSVGKAGRQWDFDWFERVKIPVEPSLPRSVIIPKWELPFRRLNNKSSQSLWIPESVQTDVADIIVGEEDCITLPRASGSSKDAIRGSLNNKPFRPGGLEESHSLDKTMPDDAVNGGWIEEILKGGPAQCIAPIYKDGLRLGDLEPYPSSWVVYKDQIRSDNTERGITVDVSLQFDDLFKSAWSEHSLDDDEENLKGPHLVDEPILSEVVSATLGGDIDAVGVSGINSGQESFAIDGLFSTPYSSSVTESDSIDDGNLKQNVMALGKSDNYIAYHFHQLVPDMALTYPFELDSFQKEAIYFIERGESVFVAAHTSAGKTVAAEYAFALASKHLTRAVYTAPIKTISNQKYRDFSRKFDVGLLTGDVSLRPEASCLIMTTEILRSMLYRGADLIRDVEWVIFDEVHYVNDAERGVVWEEVIIMLPRHVNIVLLSATVPNTHEFADWIGRTKQKKIRVTGTSKRPVPLEHCLFYSGEIYKVCEDEKFIPQGLKAVKEAFKKSNLHFGGGPDVRSASLSQNTGRGRSEHSKGAKQNKHSSSSNNKGLVANLGISISSGEGQHNLGFRKEASLWMQLVNKLSKKSLLPVVIFCFSKNRCDKSSDSMFGSDFTTSSEKSEIRVFYDKAFSRLKGSDRHLPQIVRVQNLLRRGIGVHHAGLLPIVKEVVEMLFCRGVIKVLFSTETFAMGVNAPARTVVFDSLRKFDGKEFRQLLPGEYTQMAGRAGRRGLDKTGTVIIMCRDEIPEERDLIHVLVGRATKLESQFRLTYIMIMHLLRVEELKVEDMLKRSFAEFHSQKKLPETQQLLMRKLAADSKSIECIKGEPAIEEFLAMSVISDALNKEIIDAIMQSPSSQQFLTPGRVVLVKSLSTQDPLLGVIVKAPSLALKQYVVLIITQLSNDPLTSKSEDPKTGKLSDGYVLMPKSKRSLEEEYTTSYSSRKGTGSINIHLPYLGSSSGVNFEVKAIENNDFLCFCKDKIKIDQVRLLEDGSSSAMSQTVQQLLKLDKNPPALDPVKDLKLKDLKLVDLYNDWTTTLHKMTLNKCHGCIKLAEHFAVAKDIKKHNDEIENLKFQMSDKALQQMPDFKGRIKVLKELGCIDSDNVVQMKGRVACEMNSGEELICTECIFENQFKDLEPEEAVAIMSAFVFQQRKTSEPNLTRTLAEAKNRLYTTALRLGEVQSRCDVEIDPKEYAEENLKFGLVEVVYEWAKGTPFAEICELTDVPEGLIVRTIVRLDETCREFRNAAAIMGNSSLFKKMELASNAIKRDIVFAASLYVTGVE